MNNDEAIKLAAKLAEPFDAATFGRMAGQDESSAAQTLGGLVGIGWLEAVTPAGAGGLGGKYRLSGIGKAAAS